MAEVLDGIDGMRSRACFLYTINDSCFRQGFFWGERGKIFDRIYRMKKGRRGF